MEKLKKLKPSTPRPEFRKSKFMKEHSENLLEIKTACELALENLKKNKLMEAYYELDMASIGVTVAKMRILKQQQNEKKDSN